MWFQPLFGIEELRKLKCARLEGVHRSCWGLLWCLAREDILSSVWLRMMDPGDPTAVESRPALEWSMVSNSSGL